MGNKVVKVILDLVNAAFNRKIKESQKYTETFSTRAKKSIGDLSTAWLGMTAVIGSVVYALKRFIDAAKVQEQAEAQMAAVLRSTGNAAGMTADELRNMASGLQNVTTFGDEAIMGAQNLLLTFTSIGRDVFPDATRTVLDMSQALGQDLSQSAVQLGKALNDPINGATALRRVGVSLTEQQMQQISAFQRSGNLLAAQRIILNELATEFGGSAQQAALTFSGRLTQMSNRMGDIVEMVGMELLPGLSDLADVFMANTESGDSFVESLRQMARDAGRVVTVVSNIVKKLLEYRDTIESIARYTSIGALARYSQQSLSFVGSLFGNGEQRTAPGVAGAGTAAARMLQQRAAGGGGGGGGRGREPAKEQEDDTYQTKIQQHNDYLASLENAERDALFKKLDRMEQERAAHERLMRAKLGMESQYFDGVKMLTSMGAALMGSSNKKIFRIGQMLAISNSVIAAAEAVMKGMSYGPFIGIPYAGLVGTALAIQLAKIKSQKPPEMAVGTWQVPRDMTATIHRGEQIIPRPMAEAVRSGDAALVGAGGGGGQSFVLQIDGVTLGEILDGHRARKATNMGVRDYAMRSVYR